MPTKSPILGDPLAATSMSPQVDRIEIEDGGDQHSPQSEEGPRLEIQKKTILK